MDVVFLSRLQFALTVTFHYLFPPLSIGLGVLLVVMEGMYLKTKDPFYHRMTRFWVKIFGLIFALGVATGIVLEFQFGTNWARYSRFVGDIFGSALAAEGIFAFFLESGFLALLLFGWDKVSAGWHFFATVMVCLGAHFSAVWIIVANSWQQTPAGHHVVMDATGKMRAEVVDFWKMVFNPSTIDRLTHTYMGAYQAAAFMVLSISAYYLLKKRHEAFAKTSMKMALVMAAAASLLQLVTGHSSAAGVAKHQPAKMAAFEGHYSDEEKPAPLYLFGWVDEKKEKVYGVKIPGMLSYLVHLDAKKPVTGLDAFDEKDRPPVNLVFQSYHAMVAIGMLLILLAFGGLILLWRGVLFDNKWVLRAFVVSVLLPQAANQLGWFSAEVGRQPWIVYGLLRTADATSKAVGSSQVLGSIMMFSLIYVLLFALFIFLLDHKIRKGPDADYEPLEEQRA